MPTILHIDINSYFATLLQQKYPALRGMPVGVVKSKGRTTIIAASKEAKKLGINTGSNTRDARLLAPNIILAPAEFDLYLDATKRLKTLFESLAPSVQIFSLDEAFINISDCLDYLHPDPVKLAHSIQAKIKLELGDWVTCNIGIGKNRFLAKLVCEVSPKGSITQINSTNQDYFLSIADFKHTCGIGFRLEKRLARLGVTNPYAINFLSQSQLFDNFGPFWSTQLRRMGQGKEPHLFSTIDKNPHMKSVGRSTTGYKLARSETQIKSTLYNLTSEIIHKTRKMDLAGRQVWIGLTGSNGRYWSAHLTLKHYINHTPEMFSLIYHHLYLGWRRTFPIIRFALRLSLLRPTNQISLSLLPQHQKQEKISLALDKISHRYGLYSVSSGLMLDHQIIRPEVTGFLGDKTYQLNY